MSKNLLAMIALVIVVGAVYLWMQANRSFNWAARYAHDGDEPFDCEIFDSIASATMPKGYTFWQESFDSLMHVPGKKSLLIINNTWAGDSTAFLRLDSCVRAGCKVLWVLENNAMWLGEKYSLNASYDYADVDTLAKSLKGQLPLDTLEWVGSNPVTTTINQGLFSSWFRWGYDRRFKVTAWVSSSSLWEKLDQSRNLLGEDTDIAAIGEVVDAMENDTIGAEEYEEKRDKYGDIFDNLSYDDADLWKSYLHTGQLRMPIALAGKVGKGWYYVSSTPRFFTNYGALDPRISKFLNRQLAQLADYPTYRIDKKLLESERQYSSNNNDFTMSPLSYMLSRPPLRWALFTLLAAVILFMLFTARRRQRVIPVLPPLTNRNLEFVRLLGTIYFRRHDNLDLLRKKYTYFKDDVRRRLMMDLDDEKSERQNARILAQRASLDEEEVVELLSSLRGLAKLNDGDISAITLKDYINRIENISKHL